MRVVICFSHLVSEPGNPGELGEGIGTGTRGLRETANFETIDEELPFLHGVVVESLRLFPPVPSDSRQAMLDHVFPDGTTIPKRTIINFDIYSQGRSEKLWGSDAAIPRPERWIDANGHKIKEAQSGSRECLGRNVAIYGAKVHVAQLGKNSSGK